MDFRQLEYFVEVVNQNSFSLAADRLKVYSAGGQRADQTAGTRTGRGAPDRSARHLHMTAAGRPVYDAVGILARVSRLRGELPADRSGQLRLGVSTIPAAYILPDLLKNLPRTAAGIKSSLRNGTAAPSLTPWRTTRLHAGIVGMKD